MHECTENAEAELEADKMAGNSSQMSVAGKMAGAWRDYALSWHRQVKDAHHSYGLSDPQTDRDTERLQMRTSCCL